MAAILPQGKTQFFDANGNPLVGGSVTFYALGTTTYQNTYQDINLSILNTNPVVLDAAGGAVIWGSGTYTMVVKDQFGNQIYQDNTSDGGAPPQPSVGNELDMIRVNATGTAYETRTPAQVLSDIGAQSSGATGTNTATLAVSTTLTAAQSGTTFNTDNFVAAGTITLPTPVAGLNYVIYGNHAYNITISAGTALIYLPDVSSVASYVMPLSNMAAIFLFADGSNWRAHTIGRSVVAPAVNANEAVQRGQVANSAPIGAAAASTTATSLTATTGTFTAPSDGWLMCFGYAQSSSTGTSVGGLTSTLAGLTALAGPLSTSYSAYHNAILPMTTGQSTQISMHATAGSAVAFDVMVTCIFIPNP